MATGGYSLVVGAFAVHDSSRVVSDLGAASISFYGVAVAVVLAATSLYRELELKTIFPVLARPIHRWEYLVGKYLGILLTMAVFMAANAGALLLALAQLSDASIWATLGGASLATLVSALVAWRRPRWRTYVPVPWAMVLLGLGWTLAGAAVDDRQVVVGTAVLALAEVGVVAAIAMLFAAFSSPFLTAVFTFSAIVVGRTADTLAHLPSRVFGEPVHVTGELLSRVVPNLMLHHPARGLLTGETPGMTLGGYLGLVALHSLAWIFGLLLASALIFRRRDFL